MVLELLPVLLLCVGLLLVAVGVLRLATAARNEEPENIQRGEEDRELACGFRHIFRRQEPQRDVVIQSVKI